MKVYKLTNPSGYTRGTTQWTPGEWRETDGQGDLCGPGWLHWYADPLVAVMLNPIHANIPNPRLWEAEAQGVVKDDHGLKSGSTRLRVLREIPLPEVTTEQRAAFGILCAWEVCTDPAWRTWAAAWLDGSDRSMAAAEEAARAAAAAWAEWAAAAAAAAAAEAAEAARAEWAAAAAARVAAWVARAAAWAAAWVAELMTIPLDLPALARRAMEVTR